MANQRQITEDVIELATRLTTNMARMHLLLKIVYMAEETRPSIKNEIRKILHEVEPLNPNYS